MTIWETVPGQRRATSLLAQDLACDRVAHAYLFCGPAGSALREGALAFAAACVCERQGCGDCDACRNVLRRTNPDVDVVEPAGMQLLVDQVRDIVRAAWRAPTAGPRRVVVVDQADRMNPNAQNAFLKALEEPPASTTIVLLAASPEALLETVRSRCRVIGFAPPSQADVAAMLQAEGADPRTAEVAAGAAGGLDRARALAFDEDAGRRRRELAERLLRLDDAGAALDAAEWLASTGRLARDRVAERHKADQAEHADWYSETKRVAEERMRREQRRAEQDDLEAALDQVTSVLRDVLVAGQNVALLNEDLRWIIEARTAALGVGATSWALEGLGRVEECRRRLRANANVQLQLEHLLLSCVSVPNQSG